MKNKYTNAPIVILLGTSSVGKGEIIKQLKSQDLSSGSSQSLNWIEDGQDLEQRRRPQAPTPDDHQLIIDNDVDSKEIYQRIADTNKFVVGAPDYQILSIIFQGKIHVAGHEINLMQATNKELDDFVAKLPIEQQDKYSSQVVSDLQKLAFKHHKEFQLGAFSWKDIMETIYQRAINNSTRGVSTILDFIPTEGYDVIAKFYEFMSAQKFSCPTHVAVAYCDINKIVEHMDKRNANGDEFEKRDGFFPIYPQYSDMYIITTDDDPKAIGTISINDVLNAANKYGTNRGNVNELKDDDDVQSFVKVMGFPDNCDPEQRFKVSVRPAILFNKVYNTDPSLVTSNMSAPYNIATELTSVAINSLSKSRSTIAALDLAQSTTPTNQERINSTRISRSNSTGQIR